MLTNKEFKILNTLRKEPADSQRHLAQQTGLSLGTTNTVVNTLNTRGLIENLALTSAGLEALAPYKVDNAIIMAAGLSSRFAPISYEKPKGVLTVKGEVLIERTIRQLQEAGIADITVVVGYKKEEFFYLEDKMNVKIVVNAQYAQRNNNSTLYLVREKLGNTFICCSDNYFTRNVFEPYVYQAYYPGIYIEGETDEYCFTLGSANRIKAVTVGGRDSWVMYGHVYFDRAFSERFVEILTRDYNLPETASKLWEDIYLDHIAELEMHMLPFEEGTIYEFDSLDDLRSFDPAFILNVDSEILDNIASALKCSKADVHAIIPLKQGLTNLSFRFDVHGHSYVYRHPGADTDKILNRESEAFSQGVARDLGLDSTFMYEDPRKGWKLSHFIDGCIPFEYHNPDHVARGLALIKRLHEARIPSRWEFDIFAEAQRIVALLDKRSRTSFADFEEISERARKAYAYVKGDGVEPCLCHNDFYAPNFLVTDTSMDLIDWEYSGSSDYASDLGVFICCSDYSYEESLAVLRGYFGREPSEQELRHCVAYVGISGYYWFVWAIYKETLGNPMGESLYLWYRYAKSYCARAIELYERAQVS